MPANISIIVPVFNEEKYLPTFLNSLLKQSTPAQEIIFCNNNSTDDSLSIIRSYKSRLPIIVTNQINKGILPTVEMAWRKSTGKIIVRTDADVVLPKDYIKKCLLYYDNHPKTQASTGPMFSAEFHWLYSILYITGTFLLNYSLAIFRGYPQLLGPNTVVRRKALENIDGYITNTKTIDDHLLTQKLHTKKYKIAYVISQYNSHSIRRWLNHPINILRSILINFNTKYYFEKTQ